MIDIQKPVDYLQGRYPDYNPVIPDQNIVNQYLSKTKDLFLWLKLKL